MASVIKGSVCLVFVAASAFVAAPAMAQGGPADGTATAVAPPAAKPQPTDQPQDRETQDQEEKGNHPAPNSVFAEGLGAGIAYSINYERMVLDDLGVRVGLSYLSFKESASSANGTVTASSSATTLMVPITASYTGIRTRHGSGLELGGGTTLVYASAAGSGLATSSSGSGLTPLIVAMVGYRLQPVDHPGFMFRVGAMALGGEGLAFSNANPSQFGFIPWGYISFGASF
jgi:hypothetical protein